MEPPVCQPVKVIVRVRPPAGGDEARLGAWVQPIDKETLQTTNHRNLRERLQFQFERVYGFDSTQLEIFNESVKCLLQHTLCGQNSTVFAYGPTGSGKTHTMLGSSDDPGVIPRCVKHLFREIARQTDTDWTVSFSYLEIYNEKVHDLLNMEASDLPIRQDQNRQIFVTGLSRRSIVDIDDFNRAFAPASRNRRTAATLLNEHSSRSHSVLMLQVQGRPRAAPQSVLNGKLHLIDLAGCEDNRKTGNIGIRLKESSAINTSLLALGQVVHALNRGQACIPYRSSKLTRLLQDSLGGEAHTCMVVTLSPEELHYFETYTTLNFARKTKRVVNTITTHVTETVVVRKKRKAVDTCNSPAKKTRSASFLGPLLRGEQSHLNRQMCRRLEKLERRLQQQLSSSQAARAAARPAGAASPQRSLDATFVIAADKAVLADADSTVSEPLGGSTGGKARRVLNETYSGDESGDGDVSTTQTQDDGRPVGGQRDVTEAAAAAADTQDDGRPATGQREASGMSAAIQADGCSVDSIIDGMQKRRAALRTTQEDVSSPVNVTASRNVQTWWKQQNTIVSFSPLFQKPSLLRRNKGFRSTASATCDAAKGVTADISQNVVMDTTADTSHESQSSVESQKEHNERVLALLSTGNAAALQRLQTVGVKRAQMVISWRQLHGPFTTYDDLKAVPGLNIKSFLKNNLIKI